MVNERIHRERARAIRIACIEQGETLRHLAELANVSRPFMSNLIAGRKRSRRVEDLLRLRFPSIIDQFPFGADPNVAGKGNKRNLTGVQDAKGRQGGRSNQSKKTRRARRTAK